MQAGLSDGAVRKRVLLKEALPGGGEAVEGMSRYWNMNYCL